MKRKNKKKYGQGGYVAQTDNTKVFPQKYGEKSPFSTDLIDYVKANHQGIGGRDAAKGTIESTTGEIYDPIGILTSVLGSTANKAVNAFNKNISKVKPGYGNPIGVPKDIEEVRALEAMYGSKVPFDDGIAHALESKTGGISENIKLSPQWNKMYREPNSMLNGEPNMSKIAANKGTNVLKTDRVPKAKYQISQDGSLKDVGKYNESLNLDPVKGSDFSDNIRNTMNRKGGKLKRRHPHPAVIIPHSTDNPEGMHEGPTDYGNGVEFGFGGVLQPNNQSSIGQGAYQRQVERMRQGGRMKRFDVGGGNSYSWDFGNPNATQYNAPSTQTYQMDQTSNQPISTPEASPYSTQGGTQGGSYMNYASTGLNAYNAYNSAGNNPNKSQGENQGAKTNAAVDSVAGAVPVYGQIYGLAKTGEQLGKSFIPDNNSRESQTANAAMTPLHETLINDVSKGKWIDAGLNASTGGAYSWAKPWLYPDKPAQITPDRSAIQGSINNNYDNSYTAGRIIQNGPNNTARNGGRIRYAQGGIRMLPGGVSINEGSGIQGIYGNLHGQSGMGSQSGVQLDSSSEVESGEKVLDNDYVLTDQPSSDPFMKDSIAKRFDKNLKSFSPRNTKQQTQMGTEKLKSDAINKNEAYLADENAKLQASIQRAYKRHGGRIEKLMKKGGRMYRPGGSTNPYEFPEVNVYDTAGSSGYAPRMPFKPLDVPESTPSTLQQRSTAESPVMSPQGYNFMGDTYNNAREAAFANQGTQNPSKNTSQWDLQPDTYGPKNWYDQPKKQGFDYNQLPQYLQYAKPAADLIGYLSKPERLNKDNYHTQIGNPAFVSDETSRNQHLNDYYTGLYNLKNSGNYSRGAQVALAGQRMKADSASIENTGNINAGIKNAHLSKVLENDQRNKGIDYQVDNFNKASKAKKNEYGEQFATDLSNIGEQEYIRRNYPEYYKKYKKNARKGGRLQKLGLK